MKHIKKYKIFENDDRFWYNNGWISIDFEHVRDLFLYRDFEDFIESRNDIKIFDEKIQITATPRDGIYIIFNNNSINESVDITIQLFKPRDYSDTLGGDSKLIKDLERYMVNFDKSLNEIGLCVKPLFKGLKRNPFDFEIIYSFSMRVSKQNP